MFSISSSSSSTDDDQYTEFDQLIDEFVTTHLPTMLHNKTPAQPVSETDCVPDPRWDTDRRDREKGHVQLFNDYFASNPVYSNKQFKRRFRIQRPLFCRIMNKVVEGDQFFQQLRNAAGKLGLSPLQKCTAAIRMLTYTKSPDAVDEYLRIGQTTSAKALEHFCQGLLHILKVALTACIGSGRIILWPGKQYAGQSKNATLILEAVADHDLWILHAFFGIPGSCNDHNVLYWSSVFDYVLHGRAPLINFSVNGHEYNLGYYLADNIYPKWATFIQGITLPQLQKDKLFADKQAVARKDVERAFEILQARFAILRQPSLAFNEDIFCDIMKACIIMHNMIVEDE